MKKIYLIPLFILAAIQSFSIGIPTLSSPSNGAINQNPNVSLNINSVSGATSYDFEIDVNSDFASAILINRTNTSCPTSELQFGETYYWRARAKNSTETSDWSTHRTFTVINTVYLSSPSNGATDRHPNVALSWNTISGLTHYDYQYDTSPTFDGEDLVSASVTSSYSSVSTANLKFGTTYYWRVRARHSTHESGWSEVRSFTTINTVYLSSPSNGATDRHPNVALSWNTVSGLTHYDYQYDTSPTFDSEDLLSASVTSSYSSVYTANLKFGTTYYWRVRARHSTHESGWSDVRNFTTINTVYLSSPSNGATDRHPNVALSWNTISGLTLYDYQYDTSPTFDSEDLVSASVTSSYSSVSTANLKFGTTYYWRVRARHSTHESGWSEVRNFTTINTVYLSSPSNGATDRHPNVALSWNTVSGLTHYDYQYDTSPTFDSEDLLSASVTSSYSSVSTANLKFGTTYYWRVRARHSAHESGWSEVRNFTTINTVYLSSPSNNSTNRAVNQVLSWNSISGLTYYDYQYDIVSTFDSENLVTASVTSSYTSVSTANLKYGTTYFWRVRAKHSIDESAWSATWSFTTNPFGAVQSTPANNSTNRPINLTLYVTTTSGSSNIDYQVDTTLNFNSPLLQELTHSSSFSGITVSPLRYGQTYYWRVRGRHTNDISVWTIPWSFTTQYELTSAPTLATPANGSNGIAYSSVNVTWNSLANANSYQYQVARDAQFTQVVKTGNTSLTFANITNLQPSTVYYWRVRGENVNGYSPWSTVWNFTTESTVLVQPTLTSPENESIITGSSATFLWNPVFGANGYTLQVSIDNTFTTATSTFNTANTTYGLSGLQYNLNYYWRVRAYDGSSEGPWSAVWSFSAIEPTLDAPTLSLPLNESSGIAVEGVTLQWNTVTNANTYTLQVSTESTFGTFMYNGSTSASSQLIESLTCETTYYWRVRASNSQVTSAWSQMWQFTTEDCPIEPLDAPLLASPSNQLLNVDNSSISFVWNTVSNAVNYTIEISEGNEFANLEFNSTTPSTTVEVTSLDCNTTYYWRVKAINSETESEWSEVWQFTTTSCTGIGIDDLIQFSIYPNPTSGFFNIELNGNASIFDVIVMNNLGQIMDAKRIGNANFDISNLKPGIYLVILREKGLIVGKKVLVKQ
jgi:hypothetical protein